NYNFQNIFLDANAYLFIFYLPIWYQVYQTESFEYLVDILKAAAIVIAIKTILVFNLFVQDYALFDLNNFYKWIRDTRTGEITPYANNFFRIFFQSHFYLLIAFFALLMRQMQDFKNKNNFLFLTFISSALLISLSRSLWLGGGLAFIFLLINIIIYSKRMLWTLLIFSFALLISSVIIIELAYNLPHYNSFNIFSYRSADTSEAAANSRLDLLRPLWQAIQERPVLGWGFGKELTYQSSDPRIKNDLNPEGWYTSYSFEWGWLDMWLKAGILMVLAFVSWLALIFRRGYNVFKEDKARVLFLLCSVLALIIIHIFSPYINHPLGLGLLMLSTIIFSLYAKKNQSYN
ncbi:MAG: O-antigen ligase family protein, partial [bacterium]|nr:O-antigen ligase family protein [bacterium]